MGDLACWSLYAAKNIGTGEGGMVTTDNDQFAEKVRMIRTHGEKAKYQSLMLGTNHRMTEIQAAIGTIQLKKLPDFLGKRTSNAQMLTKNLEKSKKNKLPHELKNQKPSWYFYIIRIKDLSENERNNIIMKMHDQGISAEAYCSTPIHQRPFYNEKFGTFNLPETEKAAKQYYHCP